MLRTPTIIAILSLFLSGANAAVICNHTHNPCEEVLWKGSRCRDGYCTNPFQGGCLRSLLETEEYKGKYGGGGISESDGPDDALIRRLLSAPRTCNSEDAPDVVDRGLCAKSAQDYPEVRLLTQNWESAIASSWIMQIVYSELLDVPSTTETGVPGQRNNFYDEENRLDYGMSMKDYEMFRHAHDAKGDCSIYKHASGDDYIPCAHMVMEIWSPNQARQAYYDALESGYAEQMEFFGMIGNEGWFITQFSLVRDPSLAFYFGMQGESNRQKLAETFKRPTTWREYCDLISASNCTVPDNVAKRPPGNDGSEDGKYSVSGSYTGYFRATEKNDCNKTEACTGHFLDYPCDWVSFFKQQAHHLGIALESDGAQFNGGYSYSDSVDIWHAANETKSDLIGYWWVPEPTASSFKDSGSDLMPVALPPASQECLNHRVEPSCNTSTTELEIFGDKKGACGDHYVFIEKAAVANMQNNIGRGRHLSRMSPAYDVYKKFSLKEFQLEEILSQKLKRGLDKNNFDLRWSTCKWVADNLQHVVESFIPSDHPMVSKASGASPLAIAAMIVSALSIVLVISATGGILYLRKKGTLARAAQIEFLLLLLVGLLLVAVGSLLLALESNDGTCIGAIWMIQVGYTMQLVPTLIRVPAIISIVQASLKMRVVNVDKRKLLAKSIGLSVLTALYCLAWTLVDPPRPDTTLSVTDSKNDRGETIVTVSSYCDSESSVWFLVMFASQGVLLLGASVLAYQMRCVPCKVNDSKELAVMIYSSFIFLLLRLVFYVLLNFLPDDAVNKYSFQKARSLLCSLDTGANVLIFFTRFFFHYGPQGERNEHSAAPPANLPGGNNAVKVWRLDTSATDQEGGEEDEPPPAREQCITFPKWVLEEYGAIEMN